jgi:hypothetical protein
MQSDRPTDEDRPTVEAFNSRAFAALLVSAFVGVVGLFALPAVQTLSGLPFLPAFGIILLIELAAVVGIVLSVFNLHTERTFE